MFSYPKAVRLRKRRDFRLMGKSSTRLVGKFLVIDIRKGRERLTRLGLTVARHYGDAHVRNRFKRLVRESFRLSYTDLPPQLDINVRPRQMAKGALFSQIQTELVTLLEKYQESKGENETVGSLE